MIFSLVVYVPSGYSYCIKSFRRFVCLRGSPPASQIKGLRCFLRGTLKSTDSTERVDRLEEAEEDEEERREVVERGIMNRAVEVVWWV